MQLACWIELLPIEAKLCWHMYVVHIIVVQYKQAVLLVKLKLSFLLPDCLKGSFLAVTFNSQYCWYFLNTSLDHETATSGCQNESRWDAELADIADPDVLAVLLDISTE